MKSFHILANAVVFLASGIPASAQGVYPSPGLVDASTGLMESKIGRDWYRGSGVIARDPRLIFSCAHVFYEQGIWAKNYLFHRAYHKRAYPGLTEGASPRGLHHFSSYASNADIYGTDSNAAFSVDFSVLYGNSSFGPAAGWWPDGVSVLKSNRWKRLIGYPAELDFTGADGYCFQHATNWFSNKAYTVRGSFLEFSNVSTGPGNSGGPIFVRNELTGKNQLAGILVSGTRRSAGVVALNLATHTLSGYALGLKPKTLVFQNSTKLQVPDGSTAFSSRPIVVSGFSGSVETIKFGITTYTGNQGDLEIYLRSPAGKIHWITRRNGGTADDFIISGTDITRSFFGGAANGTWLLMMRDTIPGNAATFMQASLEISAL